MNDLISRNALLDFIKQTTDENDWLVNQYNADWIYSFIESAPSVEAEPKHGRWEDVPHHEGTIRCSNCKAYLPGECEGEYCKKCGANMDGGNGDG